KLHYNMGRKQSSGRPSDHHRGLSSGTSSSAALSDGADGLQVDRVIRDDGAEAVDEVGIAATETGGALEAYAGDGLAQARVGPFVGKKGHGLIAGATQRNGVRGVAVVPGRRSEERRVGKEC